MSRKGYKQSEEHKEKLRKFLKPFSKGNDNRRFSKGKKHSSETREKLSGENNHFWKGGITKENERIRNSYEYKLWRTAVFERDKYMCVWCGYSKGRKLNADHIKPFADYPELRFAIDNGRTLCIDCHKKTDTWGRRRS